MGIPASFSPVSAREACARLEVPAGTLYSWVSRYGVPRMWVPPHTLPRQPSGGMLYDFGDLLVIEREIRHRHPVPSTPQLRARIREACPLALALRG